MSRLHVSHERKRQLIWIGAVLLVVLVCDQASKEVVRQTIPLMAGIGTDQEDRFFHFTHQHNYGLVGGAFSDMPWVAKIAPIAATLVLLYLYRHLAPASRWQSIAYGLVGGGAAGNLIDRLMRGYVTDFLQFHFYFVPFDFPWKKYPAFNVADSAICVGVALLIITWHRMEKHYIEQQNSREAQKTAPVE